VLSQLWDFIQPCAFFTRQPRKSHMCVPETQDTLSLRECLSPINGSNSPHFCVCFKS
jgi:hypothetical protein